MRHLKAGRKLGRNATHRLALMRNLAQALIIHGRIITTVEKAKEARRFVEKLITLAKKNSLHARRLAMARLGSTGHAAAITGEKDTETRSIVAKLFEDVAPRFHDRAGGYTRIIKRHERRLGDAGQTAFLELLKEGETKIRARAPQPRPAPAPRVSDIEKPSEQEPPPATENP